MTQDIEGGDSFPDVSTEFLAYIRGFLCDDQLVPRRQFANRVLVDAALCRRHGYGLDFVRAEANFSGLSSQIVVRDGSEYIEFTKWKANT